MKYLIHESRKYRKSFKRLSHSGNLTKNRLKNLNDVINILARGEKLHAKYEDHQLKGILKEFRECHIYSDLLLLYQFQEEKLILILVNIGSHSDFFSK
jgi:mRNA interferase YafQ